MVKIRFKINILNHSINVKHPAMNYLIDVNKNATKFMIYKLRKGYNNASMPNKVLKQSLSMAMTNLNRNIMK